VEEIGVLVHDGHERAEVREAEVPRVAAADEHPAALGIVEAQEEPGHRRLARAARTDNGHALARLHAEGEARVSGAAPAWISEGHVVERHRGSEPPDVGGRAGLVTDRRRGREQRQHSPRGGEAQHALVKEHAEVPQRPEHLDAQHEDDQQRLDGHGPGQDALDAPAEGRRRAERDADVGDPARERVRPEDAHGRLEEVATPGREERRARPALAERLQRAQPLDGVEELRAEGGVGALAREAPRAVPAVPEARGRERHEGRREQGERDRHVQPRHEREDQRGRERGHEELREVLAEVHLELLHALDDGQQDVAGPGRREMGGPEEQHVGVHGLAEPRLHPGRRPVSDHGADVVEDAAEHRGNRHRRRRADQRGERRAGEDAAEEPPEEGEASDPGGHRQETQEDRARDPASDPCGEGPELPV
jgi:hypothetical protein